MKIFRLLRTWLEPPVFPNEAEKTHQAYLITLIIWAGFFILTLVSVILTWLITTTSFARSLLAVLTILACMIISKALLNRGRVQETGLFITAVLWITFAWITLNGKGGLTGIPFLGAVALTPLIAGFVSSSRASVIITGLNWLLGIIVVWLEMTGRVPSGDYLPLGRYFALMVMFSSFPLLVFLWRRNFEAAIARVRAVEQAERETAAYRLQNETLEAAVKVRTNALEESLQREQHLAEKLAVALELETQLGQLQSRIITVVSHEFRTPLSVINSSAELLHRFYDKMPEEKREAAHRRIRESIFYLHDLLKDVTLVDQAQRSQIRPSYQTISFNTLCQQLTERVQQELNKPDRLAFEFGKQIETPIQVDLTLLQQIITNLIANALKYSADDKVVRVRYWLDKSQVVIEVQDEGIGIPLHEQSKVFELFYRASNVDEKRGLGLGLFIAQAITRLMQGTLEVQSLGEGLGTTFIIRLPILPDIERVIA